MSNKQVEALGLYISAAAMFVSGVLFLISPTATFLSLIPALVCFFLSVSAGTSAEKLLK